MTIRLVSHYAKDAISLDKPSPLANPKPRFAERDRDWNTSQYERSYNNETHHHMICTSCGKVSEFEDETLKQAIADTKLKGFHASHYSLYIYGLCNKCMAAKRKKSK